MTLTFSVAETAEGWTVFEGGVALETRNDKREAVAVGHLLALGTKAAGGAAKLLVQRGASEFEPWDTDSGAGSADLIVSAASVQAPPLSCPAAVARRSGARVDRSERRPLSRRRR